MKASLRQPIILSFLVLLVPFTSCTVSSSESNEIREMEEFQIPSEFDWTMNNAVQFVLKSRYGGIVRIESPDNDFLHYYNLPADRDTHFSLSVPSVVTKLSVRLRDQEKTFTADPNQIIAHEFDVP